MVSRSSTNRSSLTHKLPRFAPLLEGGTRRRVFGTGISFCKLNRVLSLPADVIHLYFVGLRGDLGADFRVAITAPGPDAAEFIGYRLQ